MAAALALCLVACAPLKVDAGSSAMSGPAPVTPACAAGGHEMARVSLIFGLDTKSKGEISEGEWRDFLAAEVTPRFPDGLTAFDGYGQWKVPGDGHIARLKTKLLVIWYAPSVTAEANIQAIRDAYKRRYDQLSVMRIDGQDCVSF